jgi:hypothetical protein
MKFKINSLKKILYLTTLLLCLAPVHAIADVIYLKDGTKIETAKVWEEEGFIRFYLQDYEDIIITYSKEIVERIERGQIKSEKDQTEKGDQISDSLKKNLTDKTGSLEVKAKPPESAGQLSQAEKTAAQMQSRQTTTTAKPKESKLQPPSAEKVEKTFNTGQVQVKLKTQVERTQRSVPTASVEVTESNKFDGVLFYNPRRTYKYWTGADSKHNNLKEAIDVLAKKFDRSPEWVEKHLGNTNDLGDIYRNLAQIEEHPRAQLKAAAIPKRLLFYDPRRPYKYWASETSQHRTLNEALVALAKEYDRSPEWIKARLGETNDLLEIHRNLMKSKAKEDSK